MHSVLGAIKEFRRKKKVEIEQDLSALQEQNVGLLLYFYAYDNVTILVCKHLRNWIRHLQHNKLICLTKKNKMRRGGYFISFQKTVPTLT